MNINLSIPESYLDYLKNKSYSENATIYQSQEEKNYWLEILWQNELKQHQTEHYLNSSNFYLNEINAYQAELINSDNLSDNYKIECEYLLWRYEQLYDIALEYEINHNLNPNGTKK